MKGRKVEGWGGGKRRSGKRKGRVREEEGRVVFLMGEVCVDGGEGESG